MGFFSNFKRGLRDDWKFEVAGKPVTCTHCGHDEFEHSEAMLNTWGLTLLDLEWANPSATVLICKNCGHLEWFLDDLGEIE